MELPEVLQVINYKGAPDTIIWGPALESITVSSTDLQLSNPHRTQYDYALITVETNVVRFRLDGSPATATLGIALSPGDTLILNSQRELRMFHVIRRDAADATLIVAYGSRVLERLGSL